GVFLVAAQPRNRSSRRAVPPRWAVGVHAGHQRRWHTHALGVAGRGGYRGKRSSERAIAGRATFRRNVVAHPGQYGPHGGAGAGPVAGGRPEYRHRARRAGHRHVAGDICGRAATTAMATVRTELGAAASRRAPIAPHRQMALAGSSVGHAGSKSGRADRQSLQRASDRWRLRAGGQSGQQNQRGQLRPDTVLLPGVAELDDAAAVKSYLKRATLRSTVVALILAACIPLAGPFVLLVYGAEFAPA